ncbi:MAG: hypothetical protein ACFFBP_05870 [Promethearchaeota archaeon]
MGKIDYRLIFGILISVLLSFITVYFFNMTRLMELILENWEYNIFKALSYVLTANFSLDPQSIFTGSETPLGFFVPHVVMWLFLGYVCGTIAKGAKRALMATAIVIIIDILLWILLSVTSGVDLMSLFIENQLIQTIGAIVIALFGGLFGGLIGGLISGPYEHV